MIYIKATTEQTDIVFNLVQNTINDIYPKYYPREVVDFFSKHHSRDKIYADIADNNVNILVEGDRVLGTGSYKDNHITRVFVSREYQGKGYGTSIMQNLEDVIALNYDSVCLDASLPACHLYEKRGYKTIRHERVSVENDVVLVFEVMEKSICKL